MPAPANEWSQLHDCANVGLLPRAHGDSLGKAEFRVSPEDFLVSEHGVEPIGEGEHLFFRIRKTGQNTRWVAKRLAEALGLPYKKVSYAGLKDRHAVTEQWFSAHMPGRPMPATGAVQIEGTEITDLRWHNRKLRPGQLSFNDFRIRLCNLQGVDRDALAQRLEIIRAKGVPNYFGPQRFGRERGNLDLAHDADNVQRLGREARAYALSALRGALFNGYLAERVAANSWAASGPDEVLVSDRPRGVAEEDHSLFLNERLPAGLLYGQSATYGPQQEAAWFARFPAVTSLLEGAGSRAARRVLVTRVAKLEWDQQDDSLLLEFALGPGAYATTVIREIFDLRDRAQIID